MTYKTHLIGGAISGIVLANTINGGGTMAGSALIFGTSLLGSVLPDIDHQSSKLAKSDAMVGIASAAVCRFTKHRGFTHTVPGALAFALATYALMMFNSAQQALLALISAFSGFLLLQVFGALRRYSVLLALAAYLAVPRLLPYIQGKATGLSFSPETAKLAVIGVFAGCISHMLFDFCTRRGVPLFWPLYRKPLHLLSVRTRGTSEGLFAAAILVVFAFTVVKYYPDVSLFEFIKGLWHELIAYARAI